MQPLISIIIPIYNRVNLLPKVLNSIKNQTYKNLEIIIVDDGSDPAVILDDENRGDPSTPLRSAQDDVILLRQENKGAPTARNKGFELSKGEYVIFWDADIVGEQNMIEKMYNALQTNSKASYAYCDHYLGQKKMPAQKFDLKKLKQNNYIHSTSLIRRKDFVVKWDESLKRFQDWDLWLSLAEKNKTGTYISETLFKIINKGTMSGWLPKFAYKKPWKYLPGFKKRIESYEKAKEIIKQKHQFC